MFNRGKNNSTVVLLVEACEGNVQRISVQANSAVEALTLFQTLKKICDMDAKK